VSAELSPVGQESDTKETTAAAPSTPSLEELAAHPESATPSLEATGTQRRNEGKGERRDRANENPLLSGLAAGDAGETTAMAEAFRAAARQRTKEETESATTEEQSS